MPGSDRSHIWPVLLAVAVGVAAGIGTYTFRYAEGLSYFSTQPSACANCHIMQRQYDAWAKSSHHAAAGCIDCHLPQDFVPKYLAKAENGWRHGKKFTLDSFEEPIRITANGAQTVQQNCVRCHAEMVAELTSLGRSAPLPCVHCHRGAGHGDQAGLGGPLDSEASSHLGRTHK